MAFVKVVKNKAYFKRFQTQFKRRREGKTDYLARKKMITQDVNKYLAPKYRLVARVTNSKIITQIVHSTLQGDNVISQATSQELKKYGLTTGLSNYSAAYATGLLLARRTLNVLKLDKTFEANKKIDGNDFDISSVNVGSRRPFLCILDIGLIRSTVGNRVFGVLKGATDGGLHIPHSVKKFPGFTNDKEAKKTSFDADVHRDRIFGVHVDNYMKKLKSESKDLYLKQFSEWDKCLTANKVKSVEELMTKVFDQIKADPVYVKKAKKIYKPKFLNEKKTLVQSGSKQYKREVKLTKEEKDQRIAQKIATAKE